MNRRLLLTGLLAAPLVSRIPGVLMPVRPLSAATLDPWNLQAVVDELPSWTSWEAPAGRYWLNGPLRMAHKVGLKLNLDEAVTVANPHLGAMIVDFDHCQGCAVLHYRPMLEPGKGGIWRQGNLYVDWMPVELAEGFMMEGTDDELRAVPERA